MRQESEIFISDENLLKIVVGENFEKVRFDPLPTIRVCTFSGHLTHKG